MGIQLNSKSQELSARFNQLVQTEARVVQQANPLVRGISDWVAGARPFYDTYSDNLQLGRNYFDQGTAAFQKGDTNQAARFLEEADQLLAKAELGLSTSN